MVVRYWGVRGSTPVPGPSTIRYGGNTACLSLETEDAVLILDAGTGIRALGDVLLGTRRSVFILPSHAHLDHVMGLPFFAPLFERDGCINVIDCESSGAPWSPLALFDGIGVPVRPAHAPSAVRRSAGDGDFILRNAGFELSRIRLNHPGGALGFRIEHGGRSVVYMTDNELESPGPAATSLEDFVRFCDRADVLTHDAQYLDVDLERTRGWGHSSVAQACSLARAANVGHLVLFHHDPARDDDAIDVIDAQARALLADAGIRCSAAREGMTIDVG